MANRVGIAGIGLHGYDGSTEESLEELVHQASRAALRDAGIDRGDVDNVVACADDLEDGRAISSMVAASPAGSYRRDFIKTTDTGIHALALAAMRIRAGVFDTCLVTSWAKASENTLEPVKALEADPFYTRDIGVGHPTGHALGASKYNEEVDNAAEAADRVVEKNTRNGVTNETTGLDSVTSRGDSASSDVVAEPLRESHIPDQSDGACTLVLGTEESVREMTDEPVWIEGLGWETATYNLGGRLDAPLSALSGAAERAYEEAGVDPREDIDLFELHQSSAYHELMACEAVDICDRTEAASRVLDGEFDREGDHPVSPSGGAFGANPLIATGLTRVASASRQLRGNAGQCQVQDAERALAHSTGGITDQSHAVAILGGSV